MKHLSEHQHRMRYRELRRDDLPIGSGAVEGAVRNLVGLFGKPGEIFYEPTLSSCGAGALRVRRAPWLSTKPSDSLR
jgi:hypothetical protein